MKRHAHLTRRLRWRKILQSYLQTVGWIKNGRIRDEKTRRRPAIFVFRFSFSPDLLSLKTKADQKFRGPQPIGTRIGIDGVIARNHIRATVQEVRPV